MDKQTHPLWMVSFWRECRSGAIEDMRKRKKYIAWAERECACDVVSALQAYDKQDQFLSKIKEILNVENEPLVSRFEGWFKDLVQFSYSVGLDREESFNVIRFMSLYLDDITKRITTKGVAKAVKRCLVKYRKMVASMMREIPPQPTLFELGVALVEHDYIDLVSDKKISEYIRSLMEQ